MLVINIANMRLIHTLLSCPSGAAYGIAALGMKPHSIWLDAFLAAAVTRTAAPPAGQGFNTASRAKLLWGVHRLRPSALVHWRGLLDWDDAAASLRDLQLLGGG